MKVGDSVRLKVGVRLMVVSAIVGDVVTCTYNTTKGEQMERQYLLDSLQLIKHTNICTK
jgi:uncharacterized protein YodC (DUF2158 family)